MRLVTPICPIAPIIHQHREHLCIIFRRAKLYSRSGFGLSEYTQERFRLSRRPCALCILKTIASKASRGSSLLPRLGISSAEEKLEKGHSCSFKVATNVAKAKIGK